MWRPSVVTALTLFYLSTHAHAISTDRASTSTSTSLFLTQTSHTYSSRIAALRAESKRISKTIIAHALPLKTIVKNLSTLEEKILDQQHQVQHQATTQKTTCGRVTSDVEKQLDVLLDQQSQASKNAKKLDDRLRKASQAKEEKSMLLVQLQEQGEEDGTATASATEKKTAHSADPQDSSPASSSTTPIKVITSSLAEGQVQVKKLQLQRHAAYAAVEDAKARVSVTTRHAAEITQECTQQQFVFEELIERLEDRGKAVHEMLEAVHEKRLNIKIFLD